MFEIVEIRKLKIDRFVCVCSKFLMKGVHHVRKIEKVFHSCMALLQRHAPALRRHPVGGVEIGVTHRKSALSSRWLFRCIEIFVIVLFWEICSMRKLWNMFWQSLWVHQVVYHYYPNKTREEHIGLPSSCPICKSVFGYPNTDLSSRGFIMLALLLLGGFAFYLLLVVS